MVKLKTLKFVLAPEMFSFVKSVVLLLSTSNFHIYYNEKREFYYNLTVTAK